MAFCPECGRKMGISKTNCPHCGHNSPAGLESSERRGLLYGLLAEVALVIGQLAAGLGGLAALVGVVTSVLAREWIDALIQYPLAFLVLLGVFVAFGRVRNI